METVRSPHSPLRRSQQFEQSKAGKGTTYSDRGTGTYDSHERPRTIHNQNMGDVTVIRSPSKLHDSPVKKRHFYSPSKKPLPSITCDIEEELYLPPSTIRHQHQRQRLVSALPTITSLNLTRGRRGRIPFSLSPYTQQQQSTLSCCIKRVTPSLRPQRRTLWIVGCITAMGLSTLLLYTFSMVQSSIIVTDDISYNLPPSKVDHEKTRHLIISTETNVVLGTKSSTNLHMKPISDLTDQHEKSAVVPAPQSTLDDTTDGKSNDQETKSGVNHTTSTATMVHRSNTVTRTTSATHQNSAFAYVYLLGGYDPENSTSYLPYLYNIYISTYVQRQEGSKQDVIVFVQISYQSSRDSMLETEIQTLSELGIQVRYIPKQKEQSMNRFKKYEKFRILTLTEYERVLYMDADLMVRGSLDYLFHASVDGTLKSNVIFAGRRAPADSSIFMVSPVKKDYDRIQAIMLENEKRGPWDTELGWGRFPGENDEHELLGGRKRRGWTFPGASDDVGLLYHWVKHEKKTVSIILRNTVQNWVTDTDGNLTLEATLKLTETDQHIFNAVSRECWVGTLDHKPCRAPYSDYFHFTGNSKPWLSALQPSTEGVDDNAPAIFWFHMLSIVNHKFQLGIDFRAWNITQPQVDGLEEVNLSMAAFDAIRETFVSPYTKYVANPAVPARFAYAYVIGGCNEAGAYRNYIYDIIISTFIQREEGSTADVVVLIQMAYLSAYETLPDQDRKLLERMDVKIQYIPKAEDESFYRIMLDKFLILTLTRYERVLFMDGDVLARGSLDYIFELSVQGVLKKNLVMAGQKEPANGGFFMLAPRLGGHDRIMAIIADKESRGVQTPYPHWDESIGWGHVIEEDDYYELLSGKRRQAWDFYGAFADQGKFRTNCLGTPQYDFLKLLAYHFIRFTVPLGKI
jgi:alpha-N-acetylglucosamine transferase